MEGKSWEWNGLNDDETTSDNTEGISNQRVIRIAGPDSDIFQSFNENDTSCTKLTSTTSLTYRTLPVILFPYRKDPNVPGSLLIVNDYKSIDGVMNVPLKNTKEFDTHLDNCDPVLSDLMMSNLSEPSPSNPDLDLAVRNSQNFVNYLDGQSSDIINVMNQIVPHEDGLSAEMNEESEESLLGNSTENFVPNDIENDMSAKPKESEPLISIKLEQVKAANSNDRTFKLIRASIIQETINDYCENILNRPVTDFHFFYKNRLIKHGDTVESLNMKEGDIIRCFDAKFLETYTVNCLVPFLERNGLTASSGSFADELLSISTSFPNGLKSIKNRRKGKDAEKCFASLDDEDFNNYMKRFLSISRRK